ncbi:hypothetical protein EV424DRAFT_1537883 [Suillus variegatus]|nr:hypothetical protein EV424DRAFT_1537883 [Suillus variegatus]
MTDLMTPCVAFSESSKLSDRILNIELLRHLARLQSDPETSTPTRIFVSAGWDITPNEEFSFPHSARPTEVDQAVHRLRQPAFIKGIRLGTIALAASATKTLYLVGSDAPGDRMRFSPAPSPRIKAIMT